MNKLPIGRQAGMAMTKGWLYILFLLLALPGAGQEIPDPPIHELYDYMLADYFSDTSYTSSQLTYGNLLVDIEFDPCHLKNRYGTVDITYLMADESLDKALLKPLKQHEGRYIYYIRHKLIAADTLDITIAIGKLAVVKKNRKYIEMFCGGMTGYIPAGRFIYNPKLKIWDFTSGKFLREQVWKEFEEKLNK